MKYVVTLLVAALAWPSMARADLVIYRLPGQAIEVVLQGKTTAHSGGTVTYKHPKFSEIHFRLREVEIISAPSPREEFNKRLKKAQNVKDADAVFQAGVWAMRRGLLPESYEATDEALALDPQHEGAQRVKALKAKIDVPLGDSAKEEAELRAFVKKKGMKAALSKHFILLHDTADKPDPDRKKNRSAERLDLLEQVYECFLLLFYSRGIELEIPQQRMKVVLFDDYNDYLSFSTGLDSSLRSASGYWHSELNIAVFYDNGTDKVFQTLKQLSDNLQATAKEAMRLNAGNKRDIIQLARTMELLVKIWQENEDIEVVSHECTHQMAGNTGLFPRQVQVPSWVHEGLATYFECPGDATWSGIGAVNQRRLDWYRALEGDKQHSNIDFIVGDQIFSYARSHGAKLHGYGQAWALTHFLVENHFDKLMEYYRALGEMPRDVHFTPELLTHLFNRAFSENRKALDQEWRVYMGGLRTERDKLLAK